MSVEQAVGFLINMIIKGISTIVFTDVRFSEIDRKALKEFLYLFVSLSETNNIKEVLLNPRERTPEQQRVISQFKEFLDRHNLGWIPEVLRNKELIPNKLEMYFGDTSFYQSWEIVQVFQDKCNKLLKKQEVRDFIITLALARGFYTFPQLLSMYLHGHNLLKKSSIRSAKSAYQSTEIYQKLSGIFEQYLQLMIGLKSHLEESHKSFESISSSRLHDNIKEIQSDEFLSIVTTGMDVHIRNAIAHSTYRVDSATRTLVFKDRSKQITLTYSEFGKKIRELNANVVALFMFWIALTFNKDLIHELRAKSGEMESGT